MASVNKAFLLGNLGQNPEVQYTRNGTPVVNLSVATNRKYKDGEGKLKEEVEWHRVVVYGKAAEACKEYLSKGRAVHVEGRIRTRKWEDRDGNARYTTEIVSDRIQFVGGNGNNAGAPPVDDDLPPAKDTSDPIPF